MSIVLSQTRSSRYNATADVDLMASRCLLLPQAALGPSARRLALQSQRWDWWARRHIS